MPKLDWIGKDAVVRHHLEVPYRLVHCNGRISAGDADAGNLLVQGDNLEALKSLLPYYAGKVKCIYIDPPYNTGNEGWHYNDKVNSPQIRKWLDKVVGKEDEDFCRHDKWLCMMYPRMRLLREFLREDGAIFVSIDDNEQHRLRMLMDEVFRGQFVANIAIHSNPRGRQSSKHVAFSHEYCLLYAKNLKTLSLSGIELTDDEKKQYNKEDKDGFYREIGLRLRGGRATAEIAPSLHFPLYVHGKTLQLSVEKKEGFIEILPYFSNKIAGTWRWGKKKISDDMEKLLVRKVPRNGGFEYDVFEKDYLEDDERKKVKSLWGEKEINYDFGAREINAIFGEKSFSYAKPVSLIQKIIKMSVGADDLVMDSFAGSGTTAHAVLQQNKEDGGNRRFILVEMDKSIAEKITAKRIQTVIKGYKAENKKYQPLDGGFRYCTLGNPLFDEYGRITESVKFSDLAAHIYFSETGSPIPKRATNALLGVLGERAIYLLYNGIMGDKSQDGGNVLTVKTLLQLPPHPGGKKAPRVVYGESVTLSKERQVRENITFRQIPYQIQVR